MGWGLNTSRLSFIQLVKRANLELDRPEFKSKPCCILCYLRKFTTSLRGSYVLVCKVNILISACLLS